MAPAAPWHPFRGEQAWLDGALFDGRPRGRGPVCAGLERSPRSARLLGPPPILWRELPENVLGGDAAQSVLDLGQRGHVARLEDYRQLLGEVVLVGREADRA